MSDRYFNRDRNRPYDNDFDDEFFNRDFQSRERNFGSGRQGYQRGNYGAGGRGQGRGMSRGSNRGFGGQGYGSEFYDRDSGGYGSGRGFGTGRGYSGGGRGFGRQDYGYGQQSGFGQQGGYYEDQFDAEYDYDDEPMWIYEEEIWLIPGPYSGMGPEDYHRSDERIQDDVNDRLTRHGQIDARKVHVEVRNGEVTLTGEVNSREAKRMCEDVVESVSGVQDVHNQLRVKARQQQGQLEGHFQGMQQGQQHQQGQQQGQQQQGQQSQRTNQER
jgi:hypothetical protein